MWFLALLCVIVVCVARWIWMRDRLAELEARIGALEREEFRRPAAVPAPAPSPVRQAAVVAPRPIVPVDAPDPAPQRPAAPTVAPPQPAPEPAPLFPAHTAPVSPSRDWEAVIGGDWLNKAGVFLLVIGIALALGYSFTRVGPAGRVAMSLCASVAMLGTGVALESRYRIFARGLIGGGWAALYFTVYAMHAVAAARVLENAVAAALLLSTVAAGMILHSLRYRSETVTGLAYIIGFVTLGIAEPNGFAVIALAPLAASLLYVARAFGWRRFALLGAIATYATCASRGDTGAPIWQAQTVFAIYWLVFEAFDLIAGCEWLLPLNAVGFFGLSLAKWMHGAPGALWQLFAGAAVAYLVSAILRARRSGWEQAATLAAGLGALTIFSGLHSQWIAAALLVEAEAFYLAGFGLKEPYLRWLAAGLFGLELGQITFADITTLPPSTWVPVAGASALAFYGNSFVDRFYGFGGAAMLALIAGYEAHDRALIWLLLAGVAFATGWLCRRVDLRLQGYLLALLSLLGMALDAEPRWTLAIGAAVFYAGALCGRSSGRIPEEEAEALRFGSSFAAGALAAAWIWQTVPVLFRGVAWMGLAAVLLELGVRGLPSELRRLSLILAIAGTGLVGYNNLPTLTSSGPLEPRLIPLWAALAAFAIALRAPETRLVASSAGGALLAVGLWAVLPSGAVAPAWAVLAAARSWTAGDRRSYRLQSYSLGAAALLRAAAPDAPIASAAVVILAFFAARAMWFSLAGGLLLADLLYFRVSGTGLTVAWAAEGLALLIAGFPLRDRVLRLSGLGVLLFCILKAFVYDLSYLDTLPRIGSFIGLGLILVSVSWLYARFRDELRRIL